MTQRTYRADWILQQKHDWIWQQNHHHENSGAAVQTQQPKPSLETPLLDT
jgi:hypothetical protein